MVIDEFTEYFQEKLCPDAGRNLTSIREHASDAIKNRQGYDSRRQSSKGTGVKNYEVGDYVVIRNVDTTVGVNKKFVPRYKGPYVVHKVLGNDRYVIRDIENCQLTQLPYDGVVEAHRIRKWLSKMDNDGMSAGDTGQDPLEID